MFSQLDAPSPAVLLSADGSLLALQQRRDSERLVTYDVPHWRCGGLLRSRALALSFTLTGWIGIRHLFSRGGLVPNEEKANTEVPEVSYETTCGSALLTSELSADTVEHFLIRLALS